MVKLLQSGWMCVLLGTLSYWGVTVMLLSGFNPPKRVVQATEEANPEPVWTKAPSWEFFNPELIRLVDELKKKRVALQAKAKELEDWEMRLRAEQAEINQVTQTVHRLRMEFDRNFVKVEGEEAANLKKLAKLFSTMEAKTTVKLFEKMEDSDIVKYLLVMKDKDKVKILEELASGGAEQTDRVRKLTEMLKTTLYEKGKEPK